MNFRKWKRNYQSDISRKGRVGMVKHILLSIVLFAANASAQSPVPRGAQIEKIATGFQFVEGPLWMNGALLFSDIAAGKIYQWKPGASSATSFLDPSYNSNGLTLDNEGNLVFCQMGYRRVVRMDSAGKFVPLASSYEGKKFNSPNDLVVKSDGSIFFTDPDYNVPGGIQNKELTFCGIYRISPGGDVELLDSTLQEPNGICFSPDETKLYVNDSGRRIIYVWDVVDDSTIQNKTEFARMATTDGNADGMKADSAGNIFSTGPLGVWVFSPSGTVLDTILVPETPSNCNWGEEDGKTLYITARTSVYRIRLASTTGIGSASPDVQRSFRLYSNFPNPFNPATTIRFAVPGSEFGVRGSAVVVLKVYDVLGRLMKTLVDSRQTPGEHSVVFDGAGLASGVYFYKLTAPGVVLVRKMVLIN